MGSLHATMKRTTLENVDVSDVLAVRAWLRRSVHLEVLGTGRHRATLLYLGEEFVEEVDLTGLDGWDHEPAIAATFVQLGEREGIVRRIRVGERSLDDSDDIRCVCILEVDTDHPGEPRWWVSWRPFSAEDGQVEFLGDWREKQGVGWDDLDPVFLGWVEVDDVQVATQLENVTSLDPPDLRAAFTQWHGHFPSTSLRMPDLALAAVADELQGGTIDCKMILKFAGNQLEYWEVRGHLPCSFDDLVRNLASTGEPALVAVVELDVADYNGQTEPVYRITTESFLGRAEGLLPTGDPRPSRLDCHLLDGDALWLGVEPEVELELPLLGLDGAGWSTVVGEA